MQQPRNPSQSLLPPRPPSAPQTRAEFDALVGKRTELVDQLESVTERRNELLQQSLLARGELARGLQTRMKALDDRSERLEQEILQADDAIAAGLARGVLTTPQREVSTTVTVPPRRPDPGDVIARVVLFEAIGFVLLGVLLWRFWWKRVEARLGRPVIDPSNRFEQLQQAVDTIAVEVERISEGQRYVTKLLNDKLQPAIGAGAAQEIPVRHKSAAPAGRPGEGE